MGYTLLIIISVIIIFLVIGVSVLTTSKAYTYKHTVDPLPGNNGTNDDQVENHEEK
ncbi:YtzI protein [Bacillus spongiae]|uniref:YtzI protein n=1 Tax=Bacillus spongiae TaxID=2683610 RepID=A0ABU8HHM1_9BACI